MREDESTRSLTTSCGMQSPTLIAADNGPQGKTQKADRGVTFVPTCVGQAAQESLRSRVACVQTAIECGFILADAVLLQHAADLTYLMEEAWELFLDSQFPLLRDRAMEYRRQREAARALLSAEWQAQREAQIQADIGAAYFIDRGEMDRAQIAANEGTAR